MSDQAPSPPLPDAPEIEAEAGSSWRRRMLVWAFLLGLGALFFWNVWERDFWSDQELRVAAVAREMVASGDWLIPSMGSQPELSRPPLVFWLSALFGLVSQGDPRWTYRVPVLAFALVSLALTYYLGKRLFTEDIGFLAMLVQGTTYAFFTRSTWVDGEIVFTAMCQLGLMGFILATRRQREGRQGRGWALLGWFGLAGTALAKSFLLGPLLVFGSLSVFLLIEGGPPALIRSWRRVTVFPGLLLFGILVLPWYVGAYLSPGGEFTTASLWDHIGLLADSTRQVRPFHYHLANVAQGFFPWTIFIPLGLYYAKDRLDRPGESLCLAAVLFPLVVLSVLPAKEPGDALFVWPYLSLVIAAALWESKQRFSLWEKYLRVGSLWVARYMLMLPLVLLGIFAVALGVDLVVSRSWLPALLSFALDLFHALPEGGEARLEALLDHPRELIVPFGVAAAAAAVAFVYSFRMRRRLKEKAYGRAGIELACVTLCLYLGGAFFYGGANSLESSREFVARVKAKVEDAPLAIYGARLAAFFYYLPRAPQHIEPIVPASGDETSINRLREYIGAGDTRYLVTPRRAYELLKRDYPSLADDLTLVDSGYLDWSEAMVLLSNKRGEEGDQEE